MKRRGKEEVAVKSECSEITRRLAYDRARGNGTSDAALAFVRWHCPCPVCVAWRAEQRRLGLPRPRAAGGAHKK